MRKFANENLIDFHSKINIDKILSRPFLYCHHLFE